MRKDLLLLKLSAYLLCTLILSCKRSEKDKESMYLQVKQCADEKQALLKQYDDEEQKAINEWKVCPGGCVGPGPKANPFETVNECKKHCDDALGAKLEAIRRKRNDADLQFYDCVEKIKP